MGGAREAELRRAVRGLPAGGAQGRVVLRAEPLLLFLGVVFPPLEHLALRAFDLGGAGVGWQSAARRVVREAGRIAAG